MSPKPAQPEPPPADRALHKQCVDMHRCGYCICTIVECGYCDTRHPPHKKCPDEKVYKP